MDTIMKEPFSDCHGAPAAATINGWACTYCGRTCAVRYKTVGIAEPVPAKKKRGNKKKV